MFYSPTLQKQQYLSVKDSDYKNGPELKGILKNGGQYITRAAVNSSHYTICFNLVILACVITFSYC